MARVRFYARGTAQVTDVDAQERGVRRFVGRRWQEVEPGRWAWVPTGKPQEVELHPDLARACKDGDLWPADAETAKACGVPFDPDYGGEVTETIKAFKAKKAGEKPAAEEAPKDPPKDKTKAGETGGKGDV